MHAVTLICIVQMAHTQHYAHCLKASSHPVVVVVSLAMVLPSVPGLESMTGIDLLGTSAIVGNAVVNEAGALGVAVVSSTNIRVTPVVVVDLAIGTIESTSSTIQWTDDFALPQRVRSLGFHWCCRWWHGCWRKTRSSPSRSNHRWRIERNHACWPSLGQVHTCCRPWLEIENLVRDGQRGKMGGEFRTLGRAHNGENGESEKQLHLCWWLFLRIDLAFILEGGCLFRHNLCCIQMIICFQGW